MAMTTWAYGSGGKDEGRKNEIGGIMRRLSVFCQWNLMLGCLRV